MMKSYPKSADAELKQKLTRERYQVTQHEGTEPAFRNEDWGNKAPGYGDDLALFQGTVKK